MLINNAVTVLRYNNRNKKGDYVNVIVQLERGIYYSSYMALTPTQQGIGNSLEESIKNWEKKYPDYIRT